MPVTFNRGPAPARAPFEAGLLPLSQKEDLCRELLSEFGAVSVRERVGDHELIHGCLIDHSHTDQAANPTASLNYDKLAYRCLGCGARGGLLWFIAQCRGESIEVAGRWLATTIGSDGQVMDLSDLMRYLDAVYATKKTSREVTCAYSTRMLEPWNLVHPYLTDPHDQGGRGIPEQNVLDLRLGYAEAYKVGERPDRTPITSERIVLPHFWKGNLVGWQTRRLDASDGTPKYLSSPDFPKDQTLYNYDPTRDRAVVVESMMSVAAHVHALPEMVATFGAGMSDVQINLLAKFPIVVLFMDNDKAGWDAVDGYDSVNARGRVTEHHPGLGENLGRSVNVFVVENPYAADPGDMSTEDVQHLVDTAVPYSVWSRPTTLLCYSCKAVAHDGPCTEGGEQG